MNLLEPIYTTVESVKARLAGKVQFQEDPRQAVDGELPDVLLHQLIVDAETEVEQDLRGRYAIPFRSAQFGDFRSLPNHSQRALRTACDMKAVMVILRTDFGKGSHINGKEYFEALEEDYNTYIDKLLGRDREAASEKIDRFRYTPPLEDVRLAASNAAADDGYHGMIINTHQEKRDAVTYASEQINNPSASYIGRRKGGVIR